MLTLTFLVKMLIDLYSMLLLLQIWMQWTRCDFYNPFSQLIVKITKPIINPLRGIIPAIGPLDGASLLLAFILAMFKFPLLMLIEMHILIFDPMYLLVGLLTILKTIGKLLFWIVMIRSFFNWASQGCSPMNMLLYQLSEPLMFPIRRIIPIMGGIDFSAIFVILILYTMNYLGMILFPATWHRL